MKPSNPNDSSTQICELVDFDTIDESIRDPEKMLGKPFEDIRLRSNYASSLEKIRSALIVKKMMVILGVDSDLIMIRKCQFTVRFSLSQAGG